MMWRLIKRLGVFGKLEFDIKKSTVTIKGERKSVVMDTQVVLEASRNTLFENALIEQIRKEMQ